MEQSLAVNEELRSFLRMRGESYGMWEPKLTNWVAGMSDEQKPKELLNSIQSELPVSPNDPCLDLGCGFGNLVIALSERFKSVSGIELTPERAEWSQRRCPTAEIVCGSAEKLPWPDNHFGLVMSTDVFEHLNPSQQVAAAGEVARVLKPGGYGFITVPSKFQLRDEHNYVPFGTWMPNGIENLPQCACMEPMSNVGNTRVPGGAAFLRRRAWWSRRSLRRAGLCGSAHQGSTCLCESRPRHGD